MLAEAAKLGPDALARANAMWSMLDDLAERDPEAYARFQAGQVRKKEKKGKERGKKRGKKKRKKVERSD